MCGDEEKGILYDRYHTIEVSIVSMSCYCGDPCFLLCPRKEERVKLNILEYLFIFGTNVITHSLGESKQNGVEGLSVLVKINNVQSNL